MVANRLGGVGSADVIFAGGEWARGVLSRSTAWLGAFWGDPFLDVEYLWLGFDLFLGSFGFVYSSCVVVDGEDSEEALCAGCSFDGDGVDGG